MRQILSATIFAAAVALAGSAFAQTPAGYPADYSKIVDAAKKEGKLVIYSTTDAVSANPLVKDFETLYPGIKVEYSDLNSTELYNRFIAEAAANNGTAMCCGRRRWICRSSWSPTARALPTRRLKSNRCEMGGVEGFGLRHDL